MFDILFGWKNASKCKRLIRKAQCRLKLLKNKRSTIVRQLRDDLVELLKHGRDQIAFDRVEQLYKDENLVQVYDLLETFCEFILINLSYIRRNKDCPNDINEAMSSLIFASARFGDLPELIGIRKLFGERYGQRFANVALELLPGNLVNRQIQEKLCIKSVSDDVKTRLLVEIARSALKSGPLLLEYSSELQQQQQLGNKSIVDPILSIQPSYAGRRNEAPDPQAPDITETERDVIYLDCPSGNSKKFLKDLIPSFLSTKAIFPSKCSAIAKQASVKAVESLMQKNFETVQNPILKSKPCEVTFSGLQRIEESAPDCGSALANEERSLALVSSSESSEKLPEETICLDDIQEFESPVRKEGSIPDQRLFMFRPSALLLREKLDDTNNQGLEEERKFHHEKAVARSFRKSRNVSGKRLRRRSVSIDITSIKDAQCAIYYGESCDSSPFNDEKYHERRKNHKKISIKQQPKSHHPQESLYHHSSVKLSSSFSFSNSRYGHKRPGSRCSLEHPCYLCTFDEIDDWHFSPNVPKIECKCCYQQCSCNGKQYIQEKEGMILPQIAKKYHDATRVSSPWASKERKHAYSRAMTMPIERPNESITENIFRSTSFPVQEHGRCSSSRHVHPKLPDYDELAAKFMVLKKANLKTEKQ